MEYPTSNFAYNEKIEVNSFKDDHGVNLMRNSVDCDFEFADYRYLQSEVMFVGMDQGSMYLIYNGQYVYKIKPEYQETFRNAIEELNS